jgi:FixJ family two-component response regulator
MLDATSAVLIIDDDVDLRNSHARLLRSVGFNARLFCVCIRLS